MLLFGKGEREKRPSPEPNGIRALSRNGEARRIGRFLQNLLDCIASSVFLLTPLWIALSLSVGILTGFLDRRFDRVFPIFTEMLLVTYGLLLIGSTVVLRSAPIEQPPILTPFWSYRAWITGEDSPLLYEDVANIVMTVPIGITVPIITRRRRLLTTLGVTVALELLIEVAQLVTRRGFCEIDDVINGALGALIGFCLTTAVSRTAAWIKRKQYKKETHDHV